MHGALLVVLVDLGQARAKIKYRRKVAQDFRTRFHGLVGDRWFLRGIGRAMAGEKVANKSGQKNKRKGEHVGGPNVGSLGSNKGRERVASLGLAARRGLALRAGGGRSRSGIGKQRLVFIASFHAALFCSSGGIVMMMVVVVVVLVSGLSAIVKVR